MAEYSIDELKAVWNKGRIIKGYPASQVRQDDCGAWIRWIDYDNRDSIYGWQVDHIQLKSQGGSDDLENLRPLQWKNNEARQEGPLVKKVVAVGNRNYENNKLLEAILRARKRAWFKRLRDSRR